MIARLLRSPVLWLAFALGLLAHAAYFTLDHEHYGADTPSYLAPASGLLHGQGFVSATGQPELRRTPGYPIFLAIFQIHPLRLEYLVLLQHLLCVFLIVAVAAITLRFSGNRLAACIAGVVMALDFATLRIANLLLTEIIATALIALTAWTLYCAIANQAHVMRLSACAGLLGSCAALVRPVGLLFFVPLSICLFITLKRRALRPVIIFMLSFLLLPALWAARNYIEGGYFGLSTIGAENLLYYRAAGALAMQEPGNYLANAARINTTLIDQTCADLESIYKRDCSQITPAQKASYAIHKGKSIILRHPLSYLRSTLVSLAYVIFGDGAEALSRVSGVTPRLAEYIVLLFTVPEAFLAVAGCWYWRHQNRNLFWLLALTVIYFFAISAGAEAYSRFKVPVMPMYALLIAGGAAQLVSGKKPQFSTNLSS